MIQTPEPETPKAMYFSDERLRPFLELMQYRINVEEIIWASVMMNLPGFSQLVSEPHTWETFSCQPLTCRDTLHSPANLEDSSFPELWSQISGQVHDIFFVRPMKLERGAEFVHWIDTLADRERRYYTNRSSGAPAARRAEGRSLLLSARRNP